MNFSDESIEAALRHAPTPQPPPALEAALEDAIRRDAARAASAKPRAAESDAGRPRPGWRRWWPVILPAAATVAFAATLAVQRSEVRELQRDIRQIEEQIAAAGQTPDATTPPSAPAAPGLSVPDPQSEIARLQAVAAALAAEVGAGEALRQENARMRDAIAAKQKSVPAEFRGQEELSDRAKRIQCVNNMKQLGLAVRIWATDNNDEFPPNILSMSNEVSVTKVLICPSDDLRRPAESWASFTPVNCSYEFLAPGPGQFEREPMRVMWRCPIHDNVTLCDGSVQQLDLKRNPGLLESRAGVLHMNHGPPPPNPAADASAPAQLVVVHDAVVVGAPPNVAGASVTLTLTGGGAVPEESARAAAAMEMRYGLPPGSVQVLLTNVPPASPPPPPQP